MTNIQPMIDLSDLLNDRREITVTLTARGQVVDIPVAYNPGVFDDAFMQRFTTRPDADVIADVLDSYDIPMPDELAEEIVAALNANQATEALTSALAETLIEIGVAMDGKPMPITEEALSKLSVPVRAALVRAMTADVFPEAGGGNGGNPTPAWAKKKARKRRKKGSFGGG